MHTDIGLLNVEGYEAEHQRVIRRLPLRSFCRAYGVFLLDFLRNFSGGAAGRPIARANSSITFKPCRVIRVIMKMNINIHQGYQGYHIVTAGLL